MNEPLAMTRRRRHVSYDHDGNGYVSTELCDEPGMPNPMKLVLAADVRQVLVGLSRVDHVTVS